MATKFAVDCPAGPVVGGTIGGVTEPLIPSTLPQQPPEKIGTDLFELKGKS